MYIDHIYCTLLSKMYIINHLTAIMYIWMSIMYIQCKLNVFSMYR